MEKVFCIIVCAIVILYLVKQSYFSNIININKINKDIYQINDFGSISTVIQTFQCEFAR